MPGYEPALMQLRRRVAVGAGDHDVGDCDPSAAAYPRACSRLVEIARNPEARIREAALLRLRGRLPRRAPATSGIRCLLVVLLPGWAWDAGPSHQQQCGVIAQLAGLVVD